MAMPTGHGLLIAEKGSAEEEFRKVYEKHKSELPYTLDFEKFHGHVTQLKMPGEIKEEWSEWKQENLPMIPDKWEYRAEDNRKRYDAVLNTIKKGHYDFIINGGDFEREGQLIQDAFFSTMPADLQKIPRYRIWANDMTDKSLAKAYKNLLAPNDTIPGTHKTVQHLSDASFIRARFDWLLGLNTTQCLSLKSGATINAGRVKLPILKILADRELEIKNFKPQKFWTIKAKFKDINGHEYEANLIDTETNRPMQFKTEEEAKKVQAELASQQGNIKSLKKKEVFEKAPGLYSTSGLEGDMTDLYGIKDTVTDDVLEKLYQSKITTYPRVDVNVITDELANEIPIMLKKIAWIPALKPFTNPSADKIEAFKKNKTYVNNKKVEAHTALALTTDDGTFSFDKFSDIEQKALYLIARSYVLPLMDPIKKAKTEVLTTVGDYVFKSNGSQMLDEGWSKAVPEYKSKDQILPDLIEGSVVAIDAMDINDGQTTPPPRYNGKTMKALLENISRLLDDKTDKETMKMVKGLGRPSTRANILATLEKAQMIKTKGAKLSYYVTPFGLSIIQNLGDNELVSPAFTARWEHKLQEVEDGTLTQADLYNEMVKYTKEVISKLKQQDIKITDLPESKNTPVGTLANGNELKEAKKGYYDSEFAEFLKEAEEAEKNGKDKPQPHGVWISKTIDTPKIKMKGSFTRNDIKKLLAGKTISKKLTFKESDKTVTRELKLDQDAHSAKIKFVPTSTSTVEKISGVDVTNIVGKNSKGKYDFFTFNNGLPQISHNLAGYTLTKSDLNELIENKELSERTFTSKAGKPFKAKIVLKGSGATAKWSFKFTENSNTDKEPVDQYKGVNVYKLSGKNREGKPFQVYQFSDDKMPLLSTVVAGYTITKDDLHEIIEKHQLSAREFTGKSGKKFNAELIIKKQKGRLGWTFKFQQNEGKPEEVYQGCKIFHRAGKNKAGKPYELYQVKGDKLNFDIWSPHAGHQVTMDDIHDLITRGEFYADDFYSSKTGENFTASVVLKGNQLEFSFN